MATCEKHKGSRADTFHIVAKARKDVRPPTPNTHRVCQECHKDYHALFGNLTPDEAINLLVERYWNSQDFWVDIYQTKQARGDYVG